MGTFRKSTQKVHKHDWKLVRKSNISTRYKSAPPTLDTIIDIVNDLGDSSELWTCPDCGEDRYKYLPGHMQQLFGKIELAAASTSQVPTTDKIKEGTKSND